MSHETSFLAAISENHDDQSTRLIYADWLEDHNDPRAELIRIEEEMRAIPVFSDRYWQLKPRRNTLREQTPTAWLEAMRYGTDTPLIFAHGFPDGVRERWRLIRELKEHWERVPLGDVGGRQHQVRQTEARLGLLLPTSLREWVAFTHDWHRQLRRQESRFHSFGSLYQMENLAAVGLLSLLERVDDLFCRGIEVSSCRN